MWCVWRKSDSSAWLCLTPFALNCKKVWGAPESADGMLGGIAPGSPEIKAGGGGWGWVVGEGARN